MYTEKAPQTYSNKKSECGIRAQKKKTNEKVRWRENGYLTLMYLCILYCGGHFQATTKNK